jgi:hypothetical protein
MSFPSWLHTFKARFRLPCTDRLRPTCRNRRARVALALEPLEDRTVPSTFIVTTTADNGNNNTPTPGSLRDAINRANSNPGLDTIAFAIPGAGVHTVSPSTALQTITSPVVIDATTQPSFTGSPVIELNGSSAGASANGLLITAGGSTVRGLAINRFGQCGVFLSGGGGNVLAGNYIGSDPTGNLAEPNLQGAIFVQSANNLIGGATPGARNLAVGRSGPALISLVGPGATANKVQGNYVGTNASGTALLGNSGDDININTGASFNIVGTDGDGSNDATEGNVLAGADFQGVAIYNAGTNHNVVAGNFIGTDRTGTVPLGNRFAGVALGYTGGGGPQFNRIGTNGDGVSDALERNIISGNAVAGVWIGIVGGVGADHNVIAGNYIGTDVTGTVFLPNGEGVRIGEGAQNNLVGGTAGANPGGPLAGAGNLISGNHGGGLVIESTGTSGNVVAGNYVGTDVTGTRALGNGQGFVGNPFGGPTAGIHIENSNGNTVGGVGPTARNLIAGNIGDGIQVVGSPAVGNTILGNYIGTDVTGTKALGNGLTGVAVFSGPTGTIIGGTAGANPGGALAGAGNLIAGNQWNGIFLGGVTQTQVQGNYIGTDVTGSEALGNGQAFVGNIFGGNDEGVVMNNASTNTIGGTTPGARNLIAANLGDGVQIVNSGATANTVQGNYIGTDVTGTKALGNGLSGVSVFNGASGITIGGTTGANPGGPLAGAGNLIAANGLGIYLADPAPSGNQVLGNFIGVNFRGDATLGNAFGGIVIRGGSTGNTVGGLTPAARNLISGNPGSGIALSDAATTGNVVEGNYIGTNAAGTAALGSQPVGVSVTAGANTIGGTTAGAGNVISGNTVDAIVLSGGSATGNLVQGNFLGTNPTGSAAVPNGGAGVTITLGASGNTVGGTTSAASNVISGNLYGVYVFGAGTSGNTIVGNYVGTDAGGTQPLGNTNQGVVVISGASNNTIGGTAAGAGNVIAANGSDGVQLAGNADGNVVQGNYIGTNAAGAAGLGNQATGVIIVNGSSGNTVGGTAAGAANVIAFNSEAGVAVIDGTSTANAIRGNSIHDNGGLGIDLGNDGVTPNDPGDADTGPNGLQNYPVLSGAVAGATTSIGGTLDSTPGSTFTIDFYASPSANPSGYGEGQRYLGRTTVQTDSTGVASFVVDGLGQTSVGEVISATATDAAGDTSEFSADRTAATLEASAGGPYSITYGSPLTLDGSGSANPDGAALSYTWTINGQVQSSSGSPTLTLTWSQLAALGMATGQVDAVSLLVDDGHAHTATAQTTLTVNQATSSITITLYSVTYDGSAHTATGTATGVGNVDLSADLDLSATTHTSAGTYSDSWTFHDPNGNYTDASGTVTDVITPPSSLSGLVFEDFNNDGQVDFGEGGIAGVTITLSGTDDLGNPVNPQPQQTDAEGNYRFGNLRPGNYYLSETQPAGYNQGIDSIGSAGGSLTAIDQFFVQLGAATDGINYNYGERPQGTEPVHPGQTASIGFWHNNNGQALIRALNGGSTSTQLAHWLAVTLPHTYGSQAGSHSLIHANGTYFSNTEVAAFYQTLFNQNGPKLDAQVLATVLSVYVTNASLDPTLVAASYGFTVSGDGAGTATVNVGSNGDAFGVANNTTMTLMDLLLATDAQAVNGVLYNGNATRRDHANNVYSAVNQAGDIS